MSAGTDLEFGNVRLPGALDLRLVRAPLVSSKFAVARDRHGPFRTCWGSVPKAQQDAVRKGRVGTSVLIPKG